MINIASRVATTAKRHWPLLLAVFMMLVNAVLHDPRVGYDAAAHRDYAVVLSKLRLPTQRDTSEFFSPPLAYIPPAILFAAKLPAAIVSKAWQLLQVVYAAVLLAYLTWILEALKAGKAAKNATVLAVLMASVWWRSFAMIRPEALLATLVVVALYHTIRLQQGHRQTWRFVLAGAIWGAACITRQWAIFGLVPAAATCLFVPSINRAWWLGLAKAAAVCAVVAAPFYLSMFVRFGTFRPFNRQPSTDSHLNWAWNPLSVSQHPFSRSQIDRPINILYGDTFGDYWAYFLARGKPSRHRLLVGTPLIDAVAMPSNVVPNNFRSIERYLRFVLLISIPAMLLVIVGCVWTVISSIWSLYENKIAGADLLPVIAVAGGTLLGYGWFVSSYAATINDTDTVKATYLLQIWPLACLLTGIFVEEIAARNRICGQLLLGLLVLTLLFNSGTFLTRCIVN